MTERASPKALGSFSADEAEAFLGSPLPDAFVPYDPAHWCALRTRFCLTSDAAVANDELAVKLDRSALARTVLVGHQPEIIVGLHLRPDGSGSPWAMMVKPSLYRLGQALRVSGSFLVECLDRCAFLEFEASEMDDASFVWFAAMGFRQVSFGPFERWQLACVRNL